MTSGKTDLLYGLEGFRKTGCIFGRKADYYIGGDSWMGNNIACFLYPVHEFFPGILPVHCVEYAITAALQWKVQIVGRL